MVLSSPAIGEARINQSPLPDYADLPATEALQDKGFRRDVGIIQRSA